ncbi:uncharacterized protein CANTADRAFT_4581 [Suhomyces tanzawaensis NRRL Y-17324]|uniref:Uncharacterized protein n=1 Tax=Suhomyces tanzawaensis NRRL Y-17324 TaxID=984487 RepID=A0A1E4SM01_9ASCO|nr:uncharacterized protein CANTADRAFT_4581 [Suhomyces tanzawaensis NRRL Y-17324]ODV80554.1 hypothetical protein CANTADRAFT_4581 [Suhomyces tanzawaensis NRRL Y-17324]
MALQIPPLQPELAALLEDVADSKKNQQLVALAWREKLLPGLQTHLAAMVDVSLSQGEQFSVRPEGVDLQKSIVGVHKRITDHILDNFTQLPPFTLPRLAEVLLRPQNEGYLLGNNVAVLKYFNALAKLVLVSSGIEDFPPITFLEPSQTREIMEPIRTSQTAVSIPLVEIPWLKQEENDTVGEKDENGTDKQEVAPETKQEPDMGPVPTISPPDPTLLDELGIVKHEVPKSPRRRRNQETETLDSLDLGQSNGSKKARTDGKKSPTTPSKTLLSDEENDRMDLSNTVGDDSLTLTSPNPPTNPNDLLSDSPLQHRDQTMEDT